MKAAEKFKYAKKMENVISQSATVPCQMISHSAVFCSKMTDFVDSYQILYTEVIKCAKDINDKSNELAKSMKDMQKQIEHLSELNRMTRCTEQQELFSWLSKNISQSASFVT